MSCRETRGSLTRWLDGRMSDRERLEVEAHLGCCSSCRTAADELRAVGDALLALEVPAVPADLAGTVLARIEVSRQTESSVISLLLGWSRAARVGAAAAALVVVLAGAGAGAGLAGFAGTEADVRSPSATVEAEAAAARKVAGAGIMEGDSLIPDGVFEVAPDDSGVAMLLGEEWTEGNP